MGNPVSLDVLALASEEQSILEAFSVPVWGY